MTATIPDGPAPQPPPAVPRHRRRVYLLVGLVVAVGLVAWATYAWVTRYDQYTDDAQIDADAVPLAARVSGTVVRTLVVANQSVTAGQTLLELDPADYRARLQRRQAELAAAQAEAQAADAQERITEAGSRGGFSSARAAVAASTAGVGESEARIARAKAAVARAEAANQKAQLDLTRYEGLWHDRAVSGEVFETVRTAAATARAELRAAQAGLEAAREAARSASAEAAQARGHLQQRRPVAAEIEAARAAAAQAHARVEAASASLELARLELGYTRVTAPAAGLISQLAAHPGQLVQAGQPLVQFVPRTAYVTANFKETQLTRMRAGQPAVINIDAYPSVTLHGRVLSFAPATGARFALLPPENATGNFVKVVQRVPVRIELTDPPPDLPLRAGLSAEVTVDTRPR